LHVETGKKLLKGLVAKGIGGIIGHPEQESESEIQENGQRISR
jgi:hypothetical protein